MRLGLAGPAALAALLAAGAAAAAPTVELRRAAVRVVVQPEDRSDIEVTVYRPNPRLPLTVEHRGDAVVIDGHLTPWFMSCHGKGGALRAFIFGKGDFGVAEFPQVLVRTPMNVAVDAGGVVQGSISRSHALELRHSGCGDWTVGNVDGRLHADVSGVGEIRTGASSGADLDLSGSGRLASGPIAGPLRVHISGTGEVVAQSASTADFSITGSGTVKTGPVSGGLSAQISGAGGLEVADLTGPMSVHVSGVGNVTVPAGHVSHLDAELSGAGNVRFGGVAESLDAAVSGAGNVDVAKVTGDVEQHVSGVGSVHIGAR